MNANMRRINALRFIESRKDLPIVSAFSQIPRIRPPRTDAPPKTSLDTLKSGMRLLQIELKSAKKFNHDRRHVEYLKRLITDMHEQIRLKIKNDYPAIEVITEDLLGQPIVHKSAPQICHFCKRPFEKYSSPWNHFLPEHRRTVLVCDPCYQNIPR